MIYTYIYIFIFIKLILGIDGLGLMILGLHHELRLLGQQTSKTPEEPGEKSWDLETPQELLEDRI